MRRKLSGWLAPKTGFGQKHARRRNLKVTLGVQAQSETGHLARRFGEARIHLVRRVGRESWAVFEEVSICTTHCHIVKLASLRRL